MLRDNGFSRSRAKAITAKGFKAADINMLGEAEIAHMVDTLKMSQLRLEEKATFKERITVGPLWSSWITLASVTYSKPGSFKISAQSRNFGGSKMAFELKIKYASPTGPREDTWLSNGGGSGNGPYKVPAGMQAIQVKGRSLGGIPQNVVVTLR